MKMRRVLIHLYGSNEDRELIYSLLTSAQDEFNSKWSHEKEVKIFRQELFAHVLQAEIIEKDGAEAGGEEK